MKILMKRWRKWERLKENDSSLRIRDANILLQCSLIKTHFQGLVNLFGT